MIIESKNKSVLITGAAKRIGRNISLHLARCGYEIIIHANSSAKEAEELKREILNFGQKAHVIIGDLEDDEFCRNLISCAFDTVDAPLFALINNASIFENDSALDFDDELFIRHIAINCHIPLKLARDFANAVGFENGVIINMLDQRVFKPNPYFFTYNISKMGLAAATKTMAQAFAPNIRVNGIAPGPSIKNIRQSDEDFAKQTAATLLKTGSPPDAISQGIEYLLAATSVTGQILAIDGGQHLMWQTPDIEGINE